MNFCWLHKNMFLSWPSIFFDEFFLTNSFVTNFFLTNLIVMNYFVTNFLMTNFFVTKWFVTIFSDEFVLTISLTYNLFTIASLILKKKVFIISATSLTFIALKLLVPSKFKTDSLGLQCKYFSNLIFFKRIRFVAQLCDRLEYL